MAGTLFYTNPWTGGFAGLTGLSKGLLVGGGLLGLSALSKGSSQQQQAPAQMVTPAATTATPTDKRAKVARKSALTTALDGDSATDLTRPQSVLGVG